MINNTTLEILAVAFGLGLLVGLQREKAASEIAGIRSFPLITLSGALTGLLAQSFGGWVLAAGMLAISAMLISSSIIKQSKQYDAGITTEVAALLMYGVGAYLTVGNMALAIVIGGVVAVLLQMKEPLHDFVRKMGEHDILAVMRFSAIALVILPILPNQTYGPFNVINPYDIWRMVVLIVGISLMGYVAYKVFKEQAGTLLAGLLGGLISSTATTVAYARSTKNSPESSSLAAIAILLASTVSVLRVTIAFAVVSPTAIRQLAPPLLVLFALMVAISVVVYLHRTGESKTIPEPENPAELGGAIIFGGLYGLIILAVAATKELLGDSGLYIIAMISGLTDVDAITLSTGRLVEQLRLEPSIGWRLVVIAIMSNLAFKVGAVAVLGNRPLFYKVSLTFGISFIGGLLLLFFWPV
ncbi:MAG: DUF4010 domain-containing protein [Agitococcus sp.]|nr:DUF4010 domain-containing protein [Agitococcus sp.]MDO9180279.1 DUF4010 domain-containing protein [Agitococcus sp.]